jgi:ABC-2 type transport system permease protein
MKQFRSFIIKEFRHIFRDRWTMLILLFLPILMLTLFGFAITTEVKNAKVAIYAPIRDEAVDAIEERFAANEYFILVGESGDPDQLEEAFRRGEIALAVVFSDDFYAGLAHTGDAQILLVADGADPNTATTIVNYATNIIAAYQQELLEIGAIPYRVESRVKLLYNPLMKGAYNFVPGVMGMILMLICAMMTSISIAREKEKGTMEVLLVSPMRPILIILAKAVPYFALSIVNLSTILLLSVHLLGVPIVGSLALLVGISLLYIFVSLALGLLISSAVDSQLVALLISGMALMVPVILLSGMMFPVENMPWPLQLLSNAIPARWYILAVKKIMIKGLGVTSIIRETAVLAGMAVFLISLSLQRFKTRLE